MSLDLFRCFMSPEAGDAVRQVLTPDADGRVYCGQGPLVDRFEQQFAAALDLGPDTIPLGVISCTVAIDLALHLIGVGEGDEVIGTALTCTASNGSTALRKAGIVWADVDPLTGLISPVSVARMVTKKTKAVIAVDWAGRHCDYAALRAAVGWNVPIIEDAAHCVHIGAEHGDYVAWSMGPIKYVSCGGNGGMLLVPGDQRKQAELLRWHGLDRHSKADFRCSQDIEAVGFRAHLTDDLAAVGLANLPYAGSHVTIARQHASRYVNQLSQVEGIRTPPFDARCDYWLHGIIVEQDRDGFEARMATMGIPTSRAHARNDYHTAFAKATIRQDGDLPGTTYFDDHQINIPGGWWVTPEECERVVLSARSAVIAGTPTLV